MGDDRPAVHEVAGTRAGARAQHWEQTARECRTVLRLVERCPILLLAFCGLGIALGVWWACWADLPVVLDLPVILGISLRQLGLWCTVGYGALAWFVVRHLLAGTWSEACAWGLRAFDRPTWRADLRIVPRSMLLHDAPALGAIDAGIVIRRVRDYVGMYRSVEVHVDGVEVGRGRLRMGVALEVPLTSGTHRVAIELDGYRSPEIVVCTPESGVVELRCGVRFARWIPFPFHAVGFLLYPRYVYVVEEVRGELKTDVPAKLPRFVAALLGRIEAITLVPTAHVRASSSTSASAPSTNPVGSFEKVRSVRK